MFGESYYDAEERSHAHIQEEFGSQWRVQPMRRRPNFPPEPDPTRRPYDVVGTFQWLARGIGLGMSEMDLSSRDPRMTLMRSQLQYPLKQSDLFVYVCGGGSDLRPGEMFEVVDVKPDGVSGVFVDFVQFGVQSGASNEC